MYISNIGIVKKSYYECGSVIGRYLMKKGIPVLSKTRKTVIFARTKMLQEAIDTMPFYLKLLIKVGVING